MNIASNPWSFVATDVVAATISAAGVPGLLQNADGTISLTTTGAHGLAVNNYVTIVGVTNSAYNGFYRIVAVPSSTTATLVSDKLTPPIATQRAFAAQATTAGSWALGVATLTIDNSAGAFTQGQTAYIANVAPDGYNAPAGAVLTAATATTVSYQVQPNPGAYTGAGTVSLGAPVKLTASGSGTAALNQWHSMVRIEDISWQKAGTVGDTLDIRDRNGQPIWQALASAAGGIPNRGKLFWTNGLTLLQMSSGIVLVTIN